MTEIGPTNFYQVDWIADAITEQCRRRYVTLRYDFGMRRHYNPQELQALRSYGVTLCGRDSVAEPFFELHERAKNPNNPADIAYFVKNGVVEFIPEVATYHDLDRTDTAIVDLDPKSKELFSFDYVKWATRVVHAATTVKGGPLDVNFKVQGWKFRFSGNRSLHLYIRLGKLFPLNDIREVLKETMEVVNVQYPVLSAVNLRGKNGESAPNNYILVDIGAMSRHRCVRSLWSLHAKTGRVCVPVDNVDKFQPETASQEEVLRRGPVQEVW